MVWGVSSCQLPLQVLARGGYYLEQPAHIIYKLIDTVEVGSVRSVLITQHCPISTVSINLVVLTLLAVSPPNSISLLPGRTATRQLYRSVVMRLVTSQKSVTRLYT